LQLTIPLAVEKVLFRLALAQGGLVPIARVFLELPLSLEEVEQYADQIADGHAVVKNEWGEFLSYEFPELMAQMSEGAVDRTDCPTCGVDLPAAPTEGGVEVRRTVLCDTCYRQIRTLATSHDEGTLDRIKSVFFGGEDEDPVQVAALEHEIFYLGLSLGFEQFTHTTLAAQSRLPALQLKARLDKMASRRYVHLGLLPTGDTVGYRFPPGLSYPKSHYERMRSRVRSASGPLRGGLKIEVDDHPHPAQPAPRPEPAPSRPPPLIRRLPPRPSPLNIKIKARRDRNQ